jgi:glycine/D-amino acid oxidase-like deaminating enzyme
MKERGTDRRRFLRDALVAGTATIAGRSLGQIAQASELRLPRRVDSAQLFTQETARTFAPVKVARNRIIRTVVGLRPFRPEGFVIRAERLGNKLLIHNYGHGGSGVTLSWGTSSLAVDLARDAAVASPLRRSRNRQKRFAVLGCGVVGLSTARLLQQRFQDGPDTVTIYAKELPPHTTSNIAGALWHASAAFESARVTETFNQQFDLACRISHSTFQSLIERDYGVRWIDAFELLTSESSLQRELECGTMPYTAIQVHRDPQRYFGYPYARQFSTMMIEPHTYLRALMRDFYLAGGKIVVRELRNLEEISRLTEPIVFNCTGLGARALFNDQNLIPVRGQLEVLLPQPEVDYCYMSGAGYMFPRRDGIILGGTWDRDDWSLAPDPQQTTSILEGHMSIINRARSAS